MALAVCLLLDDRGAATVRELWRRLEEVGVPTLLSHTHGRHLPHLTYASLRSYDLEVVRDELVSLPARTPVTLYLDGFGTFRRSRCWLAPAVDLGLVERQQQVVDAVLRCGADLHRHYRPGAWLPHVTLASRLHLRDLPAVAACVYDVLPLQLTADRAALIETSDGTTHPLPHLI